MSPCSVVNISSGYTLSAVKIVKTPLRVLYHRNEILRGTLVASSRAFVYQILYNAIENTAVRMQENRCI